MRAAGSRACGRVEVEACLKELEVDPWLAWKGEVGPST